MNVTATVDKNVCTILVSGKVDSTNAAQFEAMAAALDTEPTLILDFSELEYISSAGLRVILRFRKKHADLVVKNVSSDVYEVLDMTGFTEMMKVQRAYRTVSVEGCEIIGRGANGNVYRIDPDTVVKVYVNADSLADIEHEREVARTALVLGIPTALSYDVVKVGDHYASMFEMLNAKSFSKLLAANPDGVDEYAKMYIDLLRLIHGTEVPKGKLPDQREVAINWIDFLKNDLPAETYEKLRAMIVAIPYDNHMIHGDYHTKNIMLQNDEVILIDMDTLAVGHPVLEVASMYNAYCGFHLLDHDNFEDFLGYPYEVGQKFWKKSLELYYNTTDPEALALYEKKAMTVGLVRLLRRGIRRNIDPKLLQLYRENLCRLAQELDTLI